MTKATLALKAPLSGPIVALEHVPDPVFAQKMVGDGISIDPTNQCLSAPCDGKIVQLHRAGHALTIEADNGLEVMMHIGLDTVSLNGVGFRPQVALGDRVRCGDALIEFDADFIATRAKSLLTQIVVTNSERVERFDYASGVARAGDNVVLTLHLGAAAAVASSEGAAHVSSNPIKIANPSGLHARPTAVLVGAAKQFQSVIHLYKGGEQANAKSVVAIMGLEINCGDQISLVATGGDAEQAIATLEPLIKGGLGEDCVAGDDVVDIEELAEEAPSHADPRVLTGVSASHGLAYGQVYQLKRAELEVDPYASDDSVELTTLEYALAKAHVQLQALHDKIADPDKAAIFSAHQELLQDPALIDLSREQIADGKSAAFAWKNAYMAQAEQLAKLKNEILAARANDLRDVGRRVLQLILGQESDQTELPANTILIAEDLTPSDTANLDREKVLGFCTMTGGASSHVAILARSMGLPAIAGIEARALDIANGASVILDASHGRLQLEPSAAEIAEVKQLQEALAKKRERDLANAALPAQTSDGHALEVVANITGVNDIAQAAGLGGEGVGLCRSEFLFMNRASAPSEAEQLAVYSALASALAKDQALIIRTLDVGGDKPLPYLPIAEEENPFLGLRGIRVSLQRPKMFRVQLRAILRAAALAKGSGARVMVMFPMVATVDELRRAKALLEEERLALGVEAIPVGIMVEVPSAAVMAEQFAREVDFFSIGTNDLTQYALAIDRGHPALAAQADGLNPGVLQLIASTVNGARTHGKWVGVCGGIASDTVAAPILLGLGVHELSVSIPAIPEVKAAVRALDMAACQQAAAQALQMSSAHEVRALVEKTFPQLQL